MHDAYIRGFMRKCAEASVDPKTLVKTAVRGNMLKPLLKTVAHTPGLAETLGGVHRAGNVLEMIAGLAEDAKNPNILLEALSSRRPRRSSGQMLASDLAYWLQGARKDPDLLKALQRLGGRKGTARLPLPEFEPSIHTRDLNFRLD